MQNTPLTDLMISGKNIKSVFLIRDIVITSPDGASVKRTETVRAELVLPDGYKPRQSDGYFETSDWRILMDIVE